MKKCFKCLKTKPLSMFYKHKRMADGHLNKCNEAVERSSKEFKISTYDNFHGITNVLGIKINHKIGCDKCSAIERHVEFRKNSSIDDIAQGLRLLADIIEVINLET